MGRIATIALALALVAGGALAQEARLVAPGADEDLQEALRAGSLVLALEDDPDATAQDFVAAAQADYRRLLTVLYQRGYYAGAVSIAVDGREAAAIAPLGGPERIGEVVIAVERGPLFRFGETVIAPLAPGTPVPEGFRRGAVAEARVIRDAVEEAVGGWRELGHAKVRPVDEDIVAVHETERLNVDVGLRPGPRLTFGPLVVRGNEDVRAARIRAIAGLPTGAVFDPDEIAMAEARLRRTAAFSAVALEEAEQIGPGDTLPVTVTVIERAPRRVGFGLELSSIDGVTVSAFWLHRNLLGGAERLRIEGEIAQLAQDIEGTDYSLDLTFERPATFGTRNDLFVTSRLARIEDPNYLLQQFNLETGLQRIVSEDLRVSAAVGLRTAEVDDDLGRRTYTLLTLPLTAVLERRDDALNPERGYFVDLEVTPFAGLDETPGGLRAFADARGYYTFEAGRPVTLAGRLQYGAVVGPAPQDAPADYLFFSGGGGTVRGQGYQSLGIELNGSEIGGRSFAGAQLEARVGVTERIGAVAFYDVGAVGRDPLIDADARSHAGAGLGVRYDSGIGPVRLDLATPASGEEAGQSLEIYIGIGQAF